SISLLAASGSNKKDIPLFGMPSKEFSIMCVMLRALTSKRFSFLACTQRTATMSKSLAHPLRVLGQRRTTQHNTHP
ncbi:hypothetical protein L1D57_18215, partial [Vibrio diabolicus]|uniref:hypothetical protein n=1 Tax=Vibrio diabolicus TaxID=50719 RepID=UPI00211B4EDD